jgi:hypothetical protein
MGNGTETNSAQQVDPILQQLLIVGILPLDGHQPLQGIVPNSGFG